MILKHFLVASFLNFKRLSLVVNGFVRTSFFFPQSTISFICKTKSDVTKFLPTRTVAPVSGQEYHELGPRSRNQFFPGHGC